MGKGSTSHKEKGFRRNYRAISSTMATVIIAAVTITLVISSSFWTGGLANVFTRFEKVEVKNAYVTSSGGNYVVNIEYVNIGYSPTSIDSISLNGVLYSSYSPSVELGGDFIPLPSSCSPGMIKKGRILIRAGATDPSGNRLIDGVVLSIKLHSISNKNYYATVTLQGGGTSSVLMDQVDPNNSTSPSNSTPPTIPPTYTLTISYSGTGYGTTSPMAGNYSYVPGDVVVTATPSSGSYFDHWTLNGVTSSDNPLTFTMTSDSNLVATFTTNPSNSKRIIFRTSHWLCTSTYYGINGTDPNAMPTLVDKIGASIIMIYYKDSDISSKEWGYLINSVNYWKAKGKEVWIIMMKTTLNEPEGTPYSVQYVIDTFKGKIKGMFFDFWYDTPPATSTSWLLSKKAQLASNGMACGYYHGDGMSPGYGDPSTDVDATYLSSQGLIPIAWLQNDNSWKPKTFNLPRFWIDYDILTESAWGGPTGQSYDEIYNRWYLGNVIGKDDLKNNAGCEGLAFMVYTTESWPKPDAIKGMIAVSSDWLAGNH